jgi:serine/threonine protein kinase
MSQVSHVHKHPWSHVFFAPRNMRVSAVSTSTLAGDSTGSLTADVKHGARAVRVKSLGHPPSLVSWERMPLTPFSGLDPGSQEILNLEYECPLGDMRYAGRLNTPLPYALPGGLEFPGQRLALPTQPLCSLHMCRQGDKPMLVKVLHRSQVRTRQLAEAINREVVLSRLLHGAHPNLLGAESVYESKFHLFLVSPYMVNGDLQQYFATVTAHPNPTSMLDGTDDIPAFPRSLQALSIRFGSSLYGGPAVVYAALRAMDQGPLIAGWFRQMLDAVHFLHVHGITHRDIKLENWVLDSDPRRIRLIDWSLANTFHGVVPLADFCGYVLLCAFVCYGYFA